MDIPEKIETKRLILRPFNRSDFEVFSNIIKDSEVSKNIKFVLRSESASDIKTLFQSIIDSYNTSTPIFALVIINKESKNRIGTCGLIPLERSNNVECFYALLSRYRGQGFAIESMKKLIEYAFSSLNLSKITAFINPKDLRLWKVAERIGMKYMGHIQNININSKAMVFTIEKSEYEVQRFY
jgi:ribosomal-protein-alanine N-acetyltransferase